LQFVFIIHPDHWTEKLFVNQVQVRMYLRTRERQLNLD
jgi:hypothetical protein